MPLKVKKSGRRADPDLFCFVLSGWNFHGPKDIPGGSAPVSVDCLSFLCYDCDWR